MQGWQPPFVVHTSAHAHSFVYACLQPEPEARATAWELLQHPWIRVWEVSWPHGRGGGRAAGWLSGNISRGARHDSGVTAHLHQLPGGHLMHL
eukprot:365171-Chlamydomonas_euryale.AAC.1